VGDGKLEHAIEDEPAAARAAAIEAEHELVDSFELGREEAGRLGCPVWRT
jgi:hypothetical protein